MLVALLGCGTSGVAQPPDGGDAEPPCSGAVVCGEGPRVYACNDGQKGDPIVDCENDGACSNGRCMSPACVEAETHSMSFAGCLFYTAEVDNVATDADRGTSFLITNAGAQPAVAILQRLGVG